jgi:hypothetical protein
MYSICIVQRKVTELAPGTAITFFMILISKLISALFWEQSAMLGKSPQKQGLGQRKVKGR